MELSKHLRVRQVPPLHYLKFNLLRTLLLEAREAVPFDTLAYVRAHRGCAEAATGAGLGEWQMNNFIPGHQRLT